MILFAEDVLLEVIAFRILREKNPKIHITATMGKKGFHYFLSRRSEIHRSANGTRFLILLDGDEIRGRCVSEVMNEWFLAEKPRNIVVRFAMLEAENWLLADRANLARFLNVSEGTIPLTDDTLPNAKQTLVTIANRSRDRSIKRDLVPNPTHSSQVGPAYNDRLSEFIAQTWDLEAAAARSMSLTRALAEIEELAA